MTDEAPSIEAWLSALRDDVEPMSAQARERLAARLVGVTASAAAGLAVPTAASALRRGFWYSRAFTAMVALPVGTLLGAVGHAYLASPVAPSAVAAPLVSQAPPAPAAPVEDAVGTASPPAPAIAGPPATPIPSRPTPALPNGKPEASTPSLERELSLLERARSTLSEGHPGATLKLLGEHQSRFPASSLQQEREALTIRALLAAGRRSEAQRRAHSFVRAYPTSALRGSVERALDSSIP